RLGELGLAAQPDLGALVIGVEVDPAEAGILAERFLEDRLLDLAVADDIGKAAHPAISSHTERPGPGASGGAERAMRGASARARSRMAVGTAGRWYTRSACASARAWRSVRSSGSAL